jgi:hypothetical protein
MKFVDVRRHFHERMNMGLDRLALDRRDCRLKMSMDRWKMDRVDVLHHRLIMLVKRIFLKIFVKIFFIQN